MIDETPQIPAHLATGGDGEANNQSVSGDFALPLGGVMCGRLVFASGAADVRIDAHASPTDLYSAHFEEHIPSVRVREGIVTIQYRRHLLLDGLAHLHQPLARIALNPTIPWEIEFRQGLSRLTADLSQLQVRALDMSSVSMAQLILSIPTMPANIYLSGTASDLTLHRPPGVALRLQIAGAASHLMLDGQYFGAASNGIQWQSDDYKEDSSRYDIGIAGSVSNLTIDTLSKFATD